MCVPCSSDLVNVIIYYILVGLLQEILPQLLRSSQILETTYLYNGPLFFGDAGIKLRKNDNINSLFY